MKQIVAVLIIVVTIFVAISIALQRDADPSKEAETASKEAKKTSPSPENTSAADQSAAEDEPAGAAAARDTADARDTAPAASERAPAEAASQVPPEGAAAEGSSEPPAETPDPAAESPVANLLAGDPPPELGGHTEDSTFEADEKLIAIYKPTQEELAKIEEAKNDIVLVVTDSERRHEISRYQFENALIEMYGSPLFQKSLLISIARAERAKMQASHPERAKKARVSDQELASRTEYHEQKYQDQRAKSQDPAASQAPASLAEATKGVLGSEDALVGQIWVQAALEKMLLPREAADLSEESLEFLRNYDAPTVEKIERGEVRELPAATRSLLLNLLLSQKRLQAEFRYAREGGLDDWMFATINGQPIPRQPLFEEVQQVLEGQTDHHFVESYFITDAILSDYVEREGIALDPEEFATIWDEHVQQYENSLIPIQALVTMFMGFPNTAVYKDWYRINQALIRRVQDETTEEELRGYYEAHQRDLELGKINLQGIFLLADEGEKPFEEAEARARAVAEQLAQGADFAQMIAEHSESSHPTKGNFGKFEHKNEWMKQLNETLFYVYYCGHPTMSERLLEMHKGDVSEPLRFSQGWAILRVADEQPPGSPRGVETLRERVQASMADALFKEAVYEGLEKYRVERP